MEYSRHCIKLPWRIYLQYVTFIQCPLFAETGNKIKSFHYGMGNIFSEESQGMPPRRNSTAKKRKAEPCRVSTEPVALKIRYVDKDAISENLHCSICQEVFSYPIALQCGHVFCDACIRSWLRPPNNTCPECRQHANLKFSHRGTHVRILTCPNCIRFDCT